MESKTNKSGMLLSALADLDIESVEAKGMHVQLATPILSIMSNLSPAVLHFFLILDDSSLVTVGSLES